MFDFVLAPIVSLGPKVSLPMTANHTTLGKCQQEMLEEASCLPYR